MDDAAAVLGVINAAEEADLGERMLELTDVEAEWRAPGLDLVSDVVLLHEDDRLVGWGQVAGDRADADVHPDARGRGVGAWLVEWTERRARALAGSAPAVIGQTVPVTMAGHEAMFGRRGYEKLWDSWILRLPADVALVAEPPAGVDIRPFVSQDELAVHELIDRSFNEWEGRTPRSFEEWRAATTERTDFDPELLLVATSADELVGAAVGIHYPGDGWIDQLAVDAAHRNRGVGRALLAALFGAFRDRGERRLGLNTDSRTGALDLYLGLGMVVEHTYVRWSRRL